MHTLVYIYPDGGRVLTCRIGYVIPGVPIGMTRRTSRFKLRTGGAPRMLRLCVNQTVLGAPPACAKTR